MEKNIGHGFTSKITTKLICLFLTLLIIFFAVPSIVYAETAEALSSLGSEEESAALSDTETYKYEPDVYEVESLREENVKHFRLSDGSYVAAVYPTAVHMPDGEGGWTDIDNSLAPLLSNLTTFDGRIKFSKKINGNGSLFTLHNGSTKISLALTDANKGTVGEVTNNTDAEDETTLQKMMNLEKLSSSVIYRDILSGTDLEYKINGNSIKENIIIKEKGDSYSYTFELSLNGLSAALFEDGSVGITDEDGETAYVIPAPIVFDSENAYGSAAYTLTEQNGNGKYTLTVTADADWMNSEERAFPVTLDPAICPPRSSYIDTYVSSSSASAAPSSNASIYVNQICTGYVQASSFSFIPQNSYISSAYLTMYTRSAYTETIGVYRVTSSWDSTLTYAKTQAATPSGQIGELLSYVKIIESESGQAFDFDITEAVKAWVKGTYSNYGVALKRIGDSGTALFFSSEGSSTSYRPAFRINYVNQNGIESYNSYSSHSIGGVASGHINLATGSLVMDIPLLTATNSLFPYTASLVYDSAKAGTGLLSSNSNVPYTLPIAPYGFKWSMQQSVVSLTYNDEAGSTTKTMYIWCDADGTEHSFFPDSSGIYRDNDGLGLTLAVSSSTLTIKSKDKITYTFTKLSFAGGYTAAWQLSSISDGDDNKIIFTYNSANSKPLSVKFAPYGSSGVETLKFVYRSTTATVPCAVYDPLTGRGVVFTYSDTYSGGTGTSYTKYLRNVKYVTGSTSWTDDNWKSPSSDAEVIASLDLTYNYEGAVTSAHETVSGYKISYTCAGIMVTAIDEIVSGVYGQRLLYSYKTGCTDVRSSGSDDSFATSDDIITRYIFDERGRAISVYSRNSAGTRVYNGTMGEYETEETAKNSLKEVIDLKEGSVNYLINGGFEDGSTGFEYWTKTTGVTLSAVGDIPGNESEAKIAVSASTSRYLYQIVSLTADTYTISLDLRSTLANGVTVGVRVTNLSNTSNVQTFEFSKNDKLNDYSYGSGIKRVSETFTITASAKYKIEIYATGTSSASSTSIYVDNVMLTAGVGMAEYNLVDFAGFNNYACTSAQSSIALSQRWTYDSSFTTTTSAPLLANSLRVECADISETHTATQRIFESSGASYSFDNDFIVSGYGKSTDAIVGGVFAIRVNVGYSDGTVEEFRFDFNPGCTDWQFVSGSFTVKANTIVTYIDVICDFSGQVNGIAYFDNISVVHSSKYNNVEYEYYENTGNLKTVKSHKDTEYYKYDSNDNLILKADSNGILYEYTYYSSGKLWTEKLYNYYVTADGNSGRQEYPLDSSNPDTLIEKTEIYYKLYGRDLYGLVEYEYTAGSDSSAKYTNVSYTYDETDDYVFFGSLKTQTDTLGNTTYYFNELTSTGIVSASIDGTTKTGTAVFTDVWGNVEKVLPVTNLNATAGTYTTETTAESVEYTYNAKNQLSAIDTDSTTYTFAYDTYGNQQSIKAGTNTLATYSYNESNGKLKTVTYGNGFVIEYFYNELENISEVWYTVGGTASAAYRYTYTETGLLHSVEDVRSGKTTVYNYDENGKLGLVTEYNTEDMSNKYSIYYLYNDFGNIFRADYMLAYQSGTSFYSRNFSYNYQYDDYKRLLYEVLTLSSTTSAITTYDYDSLQRIVNSELNYNDTFVLDTDYTFSETTEQTSAQVKTYKTTVNGTATTYSYTYDSRGYITAISVGGSQKYRYVYDNLGQLVREDNVPKNQTYVYTYDNSGNLTSKKIYSLTAQGLTPIGTSTTKSYSYSTGTWGDLLTSFNGGSITYDGIGNPTKYYDGKTFTWEGRRLVGAVNGSTTMSFTYNDEGMRTSKTVAGVTTNYYYNGSQLIAEETNGNVTVYLYNNTGIIGFQYHSSSYSSSTWDTYFFEKNVQGDVVAVYTSTGVKKISYTYDAWGNFTATYHNGASASTLNNAITYRGYYYDKDLGLYYLNSRYYDSNTGRFINADNQLSTSSDLIGVNLFSYCGNNPVNRIDLYGHSWEEIEEYLSNVYEGVKKIAYMAAEFIVKEASSLYDTVTEWHFEERERRNGKHPNHSEVKNESSGWVLLPSSQSIYHDNGVGKRELKYVKSDGREAVFDGDTLEPITDPRYIATYNYCPLYQVPNTNPVFFDYVKWAGSGIGHFFVDMVPYYLTGNSNTREQFESKIFIFE